LENISKRNIWALKRSPADQATSEFEKVRTARERSIRSAAGSCLGYRKYFGFAGGKSTLTNGRNLRATIGRAIFPD
jgi:hypothetical protein